jgi:hypothetical protein
MSKYFIIFFLTIAGLQSCKLKKPFSESRPVEEKEYRFPLDWIGDYEGELLIFGQNNDTLVAKMELSIEHLSPAGYYPWTIRYNDSDIRAYGLEPINPNAEYYQIDEFNSVKLDAYYKGGHFVSRFDVMGNDILIDYKRIPGGIEVLLYISSREAINVSGGEVIAQDTVPYVESYELKAFQTAFLKKKNG